MNGEILDIQGLRKSFGGVKALADFSCSLRRGEILGLIGPNGAGKTTLFNVVSGFGPPDDGRVVFKGKDITSAVPHRIANLGIGRTFQHVRLIRQISVLDNVVLCFKEQSGERLGGVFLRWRRSQDQEAVNQREAMTLLEEHSLGHQASDRAQDLSYGQQKLLSLVCCMAAEPDLLLLDEPVAGIAPEMSHRTLATIRELPSQGRSVILIEHNLDAVAQVCHRVIFMDAGVKVSEGTPHEVRNDPRVIEAYID